MFTGVKLVILESSKHNQRHRCPEIKLAGLVTKVEFGIFILKGVDRMFYRNRSSFHVTLAASRPHVKIIRQSFPKSNMYSIRNLTGDSAFSVKSSEEDSATLNSQNDFYNIEQVAGLLGISEQAVCNWINNRKIKLEGALEDSRDIRIPKKHFENLNDPSKEFSKRIEEILGNTTLELHDPKDVFRSRRDVE